MEVSVYNDRPGGSNFEVMRRAEQTENFLDYLRCYICLKKLQKRTKRRVLIL